jgi:hypothetical protein
MFGDVGTGVSGLFLPYQNAERQFLNRLQFRNIYGSGKVRLKLLS